MQQRVQAPSYFSRVNPFSPQISLEHLDLPDQEVLLQIGQRLLPLFGLAYGQPLDPVIQQTNIARLAEAALEAYLAISHRRLFIKALIAVWYRQKEEGEYPLDAAAALAAIRGQSEALLALDDQAHRPY